MSVTPIRRANSCESSLLHSLASIHMNTLSRSCQASMRAPPRRSSAPTAHRDDPNRSTTPHGILRHEDNPIMTPQQRRVSFAHQVDGTIWQHISSYDPEASPKETSSPKAARPSFRAATPPIPPRTPVTSQRDLEKLLRKDHKISLPFPTTPRSPPIRAFGRLETERGKRPISPNSMATPPPCPRSESRPCASRSDYTLGEAARSISHMIHDPTPLKATVQVSALKNYDFAFIKRTDGSWTYAILAYRSKSQDGEEFMMFVMDEDGSTKIIRMRHWAEYVRRVAEEEEAVPESIEMGGQEEDSSLATSSSKESLE